MPFSIESYSISDLTKDLLAMFHPLQVFMPPDSRRVHPHDHHDGRAQKQQNPQCRLSHGRKSLIDPFTCAPCRTGYCSPPLPKTKHNAQHIERDPISAALGRIKGISRYPDGPSSFRLSSPMSPISLCARLAGIKGTFCFSGAVCSANRLLSALGAGAHDGSEAQLVGHRAGAPMIRLMMESSRRLSALICGFILLRTGSGPG